MPKSSSPGQRTNDWPVVAQFQVDVFADECVAFLEGHGIPAVRLPLRVSAYASQGFMEPVRVLVPPDRAEEAAELLAE